MRIVLLIPVGIDRPSGRRYFHLARGLVRLGHRVRILALHADLAAAQERRFVQEGVEVWYVGQMHVRKAGSHIERFGAARLVRVLVGATWGMILGVLQSSADVYHLGKPQPVNGVAALLAVCVLRQQRFYVDCDDDERYSNRFGAAWQARLFGAFQWLLPRLARGVTVNSQALAEQVVPRGKRVALVPNGVDVAAWAEKDEQMVAGLRAALGLDGCRVIAYVGSMTLHNHPVDLLLEAFADLADQWADLRLLMVGGGEDLSKLQVWAGQLGLADRVLFTGAVPHALVAPLLRLAEISVDPVVDDAVARGRSPLKLLESLAVGVTVVTGDVGDRANLLDQGRGGLLVAPGDAAALADGIDALLRDPARRAALAAHGREHVAAYDWDRLAATWATVYSGHAGNQVESSR